MKTGSTIHNCCVFDLQKVHNKSGNLTYVEQFHHLWFDVKRVYYLYDVPGGADRGGHAHKKLQQLIVAASGSFDVIIEDGISRKVVELNRPNFGLMILPGIWRELTNFSSGAICLVLASEKYDPQDYIRSYDSFIKYKKLINSGNG